MTWFNSPKFLKIPRHLVQKKTRQNVHKMWMPSKQTVINQCKEVGFINYAQADLLMAQMEYQYLYVFQKPE